MSSMYQTPKNTVPVSPELRKEFVNEVKRFDQPTVSQYKMLEESVQLQQQEIARLRRDLARLRNQLVEVTNFISSRG